VDVPGFVSALRFQQQPSGGVAWTTFRTQPVVSVQDATGATVATDNATVVTISLNNARGATLSCAGGLSRTVVAGLANFAGCSVDLPNGAYSLRVVAVPGLTPLDSSAFNTTPVNYGYWLVVPLVAGDGDQ
jgi:trimeric autotransporter adhesin